MNLTGWLALVALAAAPADPDALLQKAQTQAAKKDWKGADKSYVELLRARPDDVSARFRHAAVLVKLKKKDAALGELQAAVDAGFQDATFLDASPDFEPLHSDAKWNGLLDAARANEAKVAEKRLALNGKLAEAEAALTGGEPDKAAAALSSLKAEEMPERTAFELLRARVAKTDDERAQAVEAAVSAGLVDDKLLTSAPELDAFLKTDAGSKIVQRVKANRAALQRAVEWTRVGGDEAPAIIGLVADGQDPKVVASSLEKAFPKAKIVVPAPPLKLTGKGRAWIDLQRTEAVLDVMFQTVKAEKVLLVGFAQGAQLAVREAVERPERYPGVISVGATRFDPLSDDDLERAQKAGLRVVVIASGSDPLAMRTNNEAVNALANGGVPTQKFVAVGLVADVPPTPVLQEGRKFVEAAK